MTTNYAVSTMKNILKALQLLLLVTVSVASQAAVESTTYILTDHLGSPILATDENGDTLWQEDYQPYGKQLTNEDGDNSVGFTGHKDDKALGVTYMQGRWYHQEMGRFLAIDPMRFVETYPVSFNRYAYTLNNPYKYVDPNGEWIEDAALALPGLVLGADAFSANVSNGDYGSAAVDIGGMLYDVFAAAVPGLPGGAGIAIRATREITKGADETVELFRAVGVREYDSIMKNQTFLPGANSLEGRQFALSFDEALKYADTDKSKVAIIKATVSKSALESFDFSKGIDPFIFKNGVYTVQPGEQSKILTESIQSIEHVF